MNRNAGLTLMEVAVVVTIISLVMVSAGGSLTSSQDAMNEFTVIAITDDRARRVLDRLGEELRFAQPATFVPETPASSSTLDFQVVEGWDGFGSVLSVNRRVALVSGNVMLDGVTLATDINSLTFTQTGNNLVITVSLQATVESGDSTRIITRTVESVLELQNL